MRAVFSALSIVFVVAVGCTVEAPSSSSSKPPEATEATEANQATEATQVGDLSSGGAADRVICPTICGTGSLCQFRDGTCTEACNSCLCKAHGGTPVTSCPAALSPTEPSLDQAFDQAFKGEACGNTVCGKGTFCCNASCSICAPNGGFCTQQFCTPEQ